MDNFIFAANLDTPSSSSNNLIGVYHEVSDENVFYALIDAIELERLPLGRRIRVEAFNHVVKTMGERRYWEFRTASDLYDEALKFSTIREDIPGLGPCGLIPLGRQIEQQADTDSVAYYPLLDMSRTNVETV